MNAYHVNLLSLVPEWNMNKNETISSDGSKDVHQTFDNLTPGVDYNITVFAISDNLWSATGVNCTCRTSKYIYVRGKTMSTKL